MIWVTHATHIKEFEIEIQFSDGKTFRVDLKSNLTGTLFTPLLNPEMFKKFTVNANLDTIVWPNGADFAPEFLYELGKKQLSDPSRIQA